MISTSFGFIASVFALLAAYFWFSGKVENFKFFKVIPLLLLLTLFLFCVVTLDSGLMRKIHQF